MKNIIIAVQLLCMTTLVAGQESYSITFQQLKEYEGLYEYSNNSTLKIAASPNQTLLFAIINQSRYALRPVAKDVFLNNARQPVTFIRNSSNQISGYITDRTTYKLISKSVYFPPQMWVPRMVHNPQNYVYNYVIPNATNDGLIPGNLKAAGLDTSLLKNMMHKIVAGDYPNVHSVLIIKGNKLIFEEYFYEYGRDTLQEQRSATKSIVSALTGIAIDQGWIKSVNDKITTYLPEYKFNNNTDLKQRITIKDLLDNQSGVNYDEAWDKSMGNEIAMGTSDDWVKYTFDLPMLDTPGKIGRYNSGNPIAMGRIVENATHNALPAFAQKNLFAPLGITHFNWIFKPDKSSAENVCQIYLRPRDMAKFGLLFLGEGKWNGKQLVSKQWVDESTSKHSVVQNVDYGYLWWLKHFDVAGTRYYSFGAQGNGGQKIYVFKQLDMVVVVTGGNFNTQSPSDELIKKYILPSFNKKPATTGK